MRLLGPFEARWSDGEPVDLTGKKVQALVAYLGVERGPRPREELANLLWGETGDDRARHNLRQALSKIRRVCPELLIARDDLLALDDALCEVDVRDFERLAAGEDAGDLERALDLYRHDLLAGLVVRESAFEHWLRDARTRLRDRACDAYDRLAAALTELGRLDQAVAVLRRRLTMDPACEQAHRALMELHARAGRRSDALRQYQTCVEALDRELGVAPSAETEATHERIRRAEPPATSTAAAPAAEMPAEEPAVAEPEPPSVAVLPFDNLSGDDDRYFADGITEDVITALSRFGSLIVIARESSFVYRGRDVDLREIGRDLGAQYVVRGSLRRSGPRVRLNVQLLEAATGKHLWAERFDREMEDVFALQDEITETVVSTLAGRVEAARIARARSVPPERLDAYDYLLRGKDYHHRSTPEDCGKAIEMFERALELDSGYAVAHAWLGCGLGQAMHLGLDDPRTLLDRAQAEAERARQLDEDDSECHRILAQVFILRHDLERARRHQERALFLNPNDDRSVCAMGTILTYAGEPAEAESWILKAIRLNPYHSESFWFYLGSARFHRGRDRDALDALDRVTRPKLRDRVFRAAAWGRIGDAAAAKAEVEALAGLDPGFDAERFAGNLPYRRRHDREALLEALRRAGL